MVSGTITVRQFEPTWPSQPRSRKERLTMLIRVVVVAGLLIATHARAAAADVYKCPGANGATYQDTPCQRGQVVARPRAASPRATATAPTTQRALGPNRSDSLLDLFTKIQASNQAEREVSAAMDRDVAETKRRLGANPSNVSGQREVKRIHGTWLPQIRAAKENSDALRAELTRRCPRGASLSEKRQICN